MKSHITTIKDIFSFYTGVPIKKQFWIHEMVKKSFWLDKEGMIAWATQQNMVPIQFFVVQLG